MARMTLIVVFLTTIVVSLPALAGEPAPPLVAELAHANLARLGHDPVIVAAVNARNLEAVPLADVLSIDEEWRNEPLLTPLMKSLLENDCARRLIEFRDSDPCYSEVFVMDQLGAIVAMSGRTSDYWQGDEAKFRRSYNQGAGAIFIDEIEYDESTMAYLTQVSVPVFDGDVVIGAITFGVNMDVIEARIREQDIARQGAAETAAGR